MGDSGGAAWLAFSRDMNSDGQLTLTDVWLWLVQLFFLPGDGLIWLMLTYAPGLARFLELGSGSYGGLFSAITSVAAWLFAFVIFGAVCTVVLDFDRVLTARIHRYFSEWRRRGRVARTWLILRLRLLLAAVRLRRRRPQQAFDLGELELTELEVEALRSHALLAPGYVMSASDLAGSLEIRRVEASRLLARLEKLALLERTFSTNEGESGYRLSQPGHFMLMARSGHSDA